MSHCCPPTCTDTSLVHSLQPGDEAEIRGPLPTFTIHPGAYDRIIMVSTGTAIAPFLQLLARLPTSDPVAPGQIQAVLPQLDLVHLQPVEGKEDWPVSSGLLPSLQNRLGDRLQVHRPAQGLVTKETIQPLVAATKQGERLLVLVCLPPR